jgi:transposase
VGIDDWAWRRTAYVGIDDWAWRRNQRYGTIICDLERRETIALLPDREPATAEAWLCGQPQISIVARDRGGGYALAAAKALPNAIQLAHRWHLMENAAGRGRGRRGVSPSTDPSRRCRRRCWGVRVAERARAA